LAEKALFVRKASGLVRSIGGFDAMIFGVHCISLSSSGLISFAWLVFLWPGADIFSLLTIAMIFCLFHAVTYSQIGATMPRAGADYVFASRTLNPTLAFASSWTLTIFSGVVAGSLIAWIPSTVLSSFYWSWGMIFNAPNLVAFSQTLTSGTPVLVIGTVFVLITFATMILPTRPILRILEIGFFLGVVAWIIIFASLLSASGPGAFQSAWDAFMGHGAYNSVIPAATAHGFNYAPMDVGVLTVAGLIMGFWIYYGYYIPTFFAGELKEAPKTLLVGSWGSLIVTWAIFGAGALIISRLTTLQWMSAEAYLFYGAPGVQPALPFITFYSAVLLPNALLVAIVMIAFVYTLVNLAQTYFFYCSRNIFAWAFDRVLPGKVADVSSRLHSPVIAMALISFLAWIGVLLSQTTTIFVQINFTLFAIITMLVPVTAAIVYPFTKKEQWKNGPSLVRKTLAGIPLMTLVGIITMGYLLWMIYASWAYPAVGGFITAGTIEVFGGVFVLGLIIFQAARYYRLKKEGLDISLTFKEIPPV